MGSEGLPFTSSIVGALNGAQMHVRLEGLVRPGEVEFGVTQEQAARLPLCDERLLALALVDPVILLALEGEPAAPDPPEPFRVECGLYLEGGSPFGRFLASGVCRIEGGAAVLEAQLVEGWHYLEPLERARPVEQSSPMSVPLTKTITASQL